MIRDIHPIMVKGRKAMAQFNVRMEADLLKKYREYCENNALDPHQQIILFIEKVVETQFDFQERLWDHIKKKK
jgi:hypothetical protein